MALFPAALVDGRQQLRFSDPLLSGERDQLHAVVQRQRLPDQGKIGFDLALFQLVQLVGHHHHGALSGLEIVAHGHIVGGRLMPRIYDENAQRDQTLLGEIVLHQAAPAVALLLGDLGIAVAGEIGEVNFAVDEEIVDLTGLAGSRAHAGEVLAVQQTVDDGGFAHVAASGERDLGFSVTDKGGSLYR